MELLGSAPRSSPPPLALVSSGKELGGLPPSLCLCGLTAQCKNTELRFSFPLLLRGCSAPPYLKITNRAADKSRVAFLNGRMRNRGTVEEAEAKTERRGRGADWVANLMSGPSSTMSKFKIKRSLYDILLGQISREGREERNVERKTVASTFCGHCSAVVDDHTDQELPLIVATPVFHPLPSLHNNHLKQFGDLFSHCL